MRSSKMIGYTMCVLMGIFIVSCGKNIWRPQTSSMLQDIEYQASPETKVIQRQLLNVLPIPAEPRPSALPENPTSSAMLEDLEASGSSIRVIVIEGKVIKLPEEPRP